MPKSDAVGGSAHEDCVEWLRPDGWWEASRGWDDPKQEGTTMNEMILG